jgi:hypothetical protein
MTFYRPSTAAQLTRPSTDPDDSLNPSPDQPGTLRQQFEAIDLFLANPFHTIDRAAAWKLARRLSLPHARRVE